MLNLIIQIKKSTQKFVMDNDHGLSHYLLAGADSNTQMRGDNELNGAAGATGSQGLLS